MKVKPGQTNLLRLFCRRARFCYNQTLSLLKDEYKAYKKEMKELKAQGKSSTIWQPYFKSYAIWLH
ncbi:MAG: helix-turn-helix domain-containing protein [Succinivibrio sp.]